MATRQFCQQDGGVIHKMVAWKFFLQNDGVSGNFIHKMATSQAGVVKVQKILKLNLTVKEIYVRVLHTYEFI